MNPGTRLDGFRPPVEELMRSKLWRTTSIAIGVLAAVVFVCDCNKDDKITNGIPTEQMTQENADDVAVQVGASIAGDNAGMMGLIRGMATHPGEGYGKSIPARVASDTTFAIGAITVHLSRTFYDALGHETDGYTLLTTRLVAASRAFGTINTERYVAIVGRAHTIEARGIGVASDTIRVEGSGADTIQASFHSLSGNRTRYFHARTTTLLEGIVFPRPIEEGDWPSSGTATFTVVADRLRGNDRVDIEAHMEPTVVVHFNGTADVDLDVSGDHGYRVNLRTGFVRRRVG
jgi:hypothetical protein